jgi:hypothetical protein
MKKEKPTHQQAYELSKFKWEKIIALLQETSKTVEDML